MVTPGGWKMSVALTNCGQVGWVTDRTGYRYDAIDQATGRPWPAMPQAFADLAGAAAQAAGFGSFHPDACLVNRYAPATCLSLHQDRNERHFDQPIVSVSLGPAHSADPWRRHRLGRAGKPKSRPCWRGSLLFTHRSTCCFWRGVKLRGRPATGLAGSASGPAPGAAAALIHL